MNRVPHAARLEVRDLEFTRSDRVLFSGLNFSLSSGEVLQVEGPNGSGKTTLLRILCGLTPPGGGEILWNGCSIRKVFSDYAGSLAYVGHAAGVKEELTPVENLSIAGAIGHGRRQADAGAVLERLGIGVEQEEVPCGKLSAGQRRRVALGRLLMGQARLWVLDEPFTALDRAGRQLIEELLSEHLQQGGMAVLTTHHTMGLDGCTVKALHLGP